MNPLKRKTKGNRAGKPSKKEYQDNLVNNATKLIYNERKEAEESKLRLKENLTSQHNQELEALRILYKSRRKKLMIIGGSVIAVQLIVIIFLAF